MGDNMSFTVQDHRVATQTGVDDILIYYFPQQHYYVIVFYTVGIDYRSILQNHIFTNTEHKYLMLLPFERGMFAVPLETTTSKLPPERALNRHKTVTSRKFQDTPTTLGR
jgi:hypothetical protein